MSNVCDMSQDQKVLLRDRLIVTLAAVLWVAGTAVGAGLWARDLPEGSGRPWSAPSMLIAPQGVEYSIWSMVYLAVVGYCIWQWLPHSTDSAWGRGTRIPVATSIGLNGLWLGAVFVGWTWALAVVLVAIVVPLGFILERTARLRPVNSVADLAVAGFGGLYLGWMASATVLGTVTGMVGQASPVSTEAATRLTAALLVLVAAVASFQVRRCGHGLSRSGSAAALIWGLGWLSVIRFTGELDRLALGLSALIAALTVALGWVVAEIDARGRAGDPERVRVEARPRSRDLALAQHATGRRADESGNGHDDLADPPR